MNNKIITIENYSDIKTHVENLYNSALLAGECFGGRLFIVGDAAIERFIKEYAPDARIEEARTIKTDGKTSAQILPYIIADIEGDSREKEGIVCGCHYYSKGNFILYKGQYYELLRRYNENTGDIILHNDPFYTEGLHKYLPYHWDSEHRQPNKVGTITDAKLNEWITWLNERRGVAQAVCNERREGVQAFMARLNQMDPAQFDKFKVNPNGGTLVKNGLEFAYKVEEDGHLHQQIRVHYSTGGNLDAFLKMAAGTYKPTEKIY